MASKVSDHVKACEEALEAEIAHNERNDIFPTINSLARNLLSRRLDLDEAYLEVYSKLSSDPQGLSILFDGLLTVAAFWSPAKLASAREARNALSDLNKEIAVKAAELATLLEKRSNLNGQQGFKTEVHYHPLRVLDDAGRGNDRYRMYVQEHLSNLRGQYSLKYWPTLEKFVSILSIDAQNANIEACDELTAAGTCSQRSSRADFFRAWFKRIEEDILDNQLPKAFALSDSAYASFASCILNVEPDDLVDAGYVKRLRQRDREASLTANVV